MKLQRIFLPLASFWKSFFPNDFSISYFYHIISSLHTVAGNGVVNKLATDSLMKKEKLKKVGSFWCYLLKFIFTDLLKKKDCKWQFSQGEPEPSKHQFLLHSSLQLQFSQGQASRTFIPVSLFSISPYLLIFSFFFDFRVKNEMKFITLIYDYCLDYKQ